MIAAVVPLLRPGPFVMALLSSNLGVACVKTILGRWKASCRQSAKTLVKYEAWVLGVSCIFADCDRLCKFKLSFTPSRSCAWLGAENAVAAYRFGSGHSGPAQKEVWPLFDTGAVPRRYTYDVLFTPGRPGWNRLLILLHMHRIQQNFKRIA